MTVRSAPRKSFIVRWDNASFEFFWGDFDKAKSNAKCINVGDIFKNKDYAFTSALNFANKKYLANKSKISIDNAETGEKVWIIDSSVSKEFSILPKEKKIKVKPPKKSVIKRSSNKVVIPGLNTSETFQYQGAEFKIVKKGFNTFMAYDGLDRMRFFSSHGLDDLKTTIKNSADWSIQSFGKNVLASNDFPYTNS